MRIGVAGLGSMGKRRVRDLLSLGHEVIGCDIRPDRCAEARERYGILTEADGNRMLDQGLDAMVISTPPDCHVPYYSLAMDFELPFFSEANVLSPPPEWFEQGRARGFPSATWRFHPLVQRVHEEVAGRDVLSVHHRYMKHLPTWHPWEPYDSFYAGARRATSAAREMVPFELDWICWTLGPVDSVCAMVSRRGTWRTEIDDTYLILLEFSSGVAGSLTVELDQLAPETTTRIAAEDLVLALDLQAQRLHRYESGSSEWIPDAGDHGAVDLESVYLAEIEAFASAVGGASRYPKTWAEERHLSDVLYAAESSQESGCWVKVEEVSAQYDGLTLE